MILLREIQERDLDALERFAQIPGFINLPNDKDALARKNHALSISFETTAHEQDRWKYIFVAEDLDTQQVLGTSMIAAQHGTVESPHFYFEVGSEEKFSDTINTGFIHGTLKLKYDTQWAVGNRWAWSGSGIPQFAKLGSGVRFRSCDFCFSG